MKAKMQSIDIPEEVKMEEPGLEAASSHDERFSVVTITFKPDVPVAENDTVSIMGEFTNWMPEIMERYDSQRVLLDPHLANTFFYRTRLFVGFKYRYHFSVGDQFVVD